MDRDEYMSLVYEELHGDGTTAGPTALLMQVMNMPRAWHITWDSQ